MKDKRHKSLVVYGLPIAALAIIFTTTDPNRLPAPVIGLVLAGMALLFYEIFSRLLNFVAGQSLSGTRQRAVSFILTSVVGLMLVLQATGQLTMRDFVSFMLLFAFGWLYVSRFSLQRSP